MNLRLCVCVCCVLRVMCDAVMRKLEHGGLEKKAEGVMMMRMGMMRWMTTMIMMITDMRDGCWSVDG